MRMVWKCMVSASNHCEVDRQRSSAQIGLDVFNTIIYSAGRRRPWVTGTGICSISTESATLTNRKLRWLDSLALWVFDVCVCQRCTSAHFAVALPFAVTGGRVRRDLRCNIIYWHLLAVAASEWERWAIWKSNCKNRFLENFIHIIELLCTLFFVRIWQPCRVWSVVCKQCLLTNARRFFADLFTYTD